MAARGSSARSPPFGMACRCRGAPHKHRNLLAHAPERLHDEITEDYNEMIYAKTSEEIEKHRRAFIRKWRLKHEAVANSLEEAGNRLFTFTRLPPSQWRSARTTTRGVQAQDQNADCAAVGGHGRHVVLGVACLRSDQHAQSRWLENPRHKPHRSAI